MFGSKGYLAHKVLFQSFGSYFFERESVREYVGCTQNSSNNHLLDEIIFGGGLFVNSQEPALMFEKFGLF